MRPPTCFALWTTWVLMSSVCGRASGAVADDPLNDDGDQTDQNVDGQFLEGIRFDTFDLRLCQELYTAKARENVAVSPVSVKLVLAMLYEAARGATAEELQQVLELPAMRRLSRRKFGAIHHSLTSPSNTTELKIASSMFVHPGLDSSAGYQRVLSKYFSASIQVVDFTKPEDAARQINNWVREATNGKITSMIEPNDPAIKRLIMVLSNALFFKGSWETPFPMDGTENKPFYLSNGQSVEVPMMNTVAHHFIMENKAAGYHLLRLPYKGGKYALYIVLPVKRNGLAEVLPTLTPDAIRNTMRQMSNNKVDVRLPKFTFQFAVDLEPILKKLGIKRVFSPEQAELPAISNKTRVHVSRILHKAGLEVNELGSTAFGATQAEVPIRINVEEMMFFHVDHPFMLFIKDDTAETIVFAAKVENPLVKIGAKEDTLGRRLAQIDRFSATKSIRVRRFPDWNNGNPFNFPQFPTLFPPLQNPAFNFPFGFNQRQSPFDPFNNFNNNNNNNHEGRYEGYHLHRKPSGFESVERPGQPTGRPVEPAGYPSQPAGRPVENQKRPQLPRMPATVPTPTRVTPVRLTTVPPLTTTTEDYDAKIREIFGTPPPERSTLTTSTSAPANQQTVNNIFSNLVSNARKHG